MSERIPFDPAVRRLLDEQAAAAGTAPPPATNDERVGMARAFMLRALAGRVSIAGLPNRVTTREVEIAPGVGARLYLPADAEAPLATLVYLHGGGWVVGSVETVDPFCRLLSEAAGVAVLSVEYRLAPEHRYPAAHDDTLSATRWAAEHASEWGGAASRIAIGGDSAGANLAAVTANRIGAETGALKLRALMLLYPVTDHPSMGHPSWIENATGFGLEANLMRWFWEQYAPGVSPDDPNVAPLRLRELPTLPPTLVTTAGYDVLLDEGLAYLEKLKGAGVAVTHRHAPDMGHNFPVTPNLVMRFPQSVETFGQIAAWLKAALAD